MGSTTCSEKEMASWNSEAEGGMAADAKTSIFDSTEDREGPDMLPTVSISSALGEGCGGNPVT